MMLDSEPDLSTPGGIVLAVYRLISGRRDQPRDWTRVRALLHPLARMRPVRVGQDGPPVMRDLSVEEWIEAASERFLAIDFFERGAILRAEQTAHLAFVSSPYESRHAPGAPPFERGVNHCSFVCEARRWLITQIAWEVETDQFPLPPEAEAALKAR